MLESVLLINGINIRKNIDAYLENRLEVTLYTYEGRLPNAIVDVQYLIPDLIILNSDLDIHDGAIELLIQIRLYFTKTKILVASRNANAMCTYDLFRLGVDGIITMPCSNEELQLAIDTVMLGNEYRSQIIKDSFNIWNERGISRDGHISLSEQEFKVFLLLGEGYMADEIASLMDLSPNTIHKHISRIIEKEKLYRRHDLFLLSVKRAHNRMAILPFASKGIEIMAHIIPDYVMPELKDKVVSILKQLIELRAKEEAEAEKNKDKKD